MTIRLLNESVSTSNSWTIRRKPGGYAEVTGRFSFNATASSSKGNLYYGSISLQNLPIKFSEAPACFLYTPTWPFWLSGGDVSANSNTPATVYILTPQSVSSSTSVVVCVKYIGLEASSS